MYELAADQVPVSIPVVPKLPAPKPAPKPVPDPEQQLPKRQPISLDDITDGCAEYREPASDQYAKPLSDHEEEQYYRELELEVREWEMPTAEPRFWR